MGDYNDYILNVFNVYRQTFINKLFLCISYILPKLLKECKNTLVSLVSLSKHRLSCLSKDVVLAVLNHLFSHICITDTRLSRLCILRDVVKVSDCVLKSVL